MCTVTYIPGLNSVLFSSSRDEDPQRKRATIPSVVPGKLHHLLYPADGSAGGTWIGLNEKGDLLILLNGGFINHIKQRAYKKSRGLVVTEMLDSKNAVDSWLRMDLNGIEPFSIIAYVNKKLHQLVWSGFEKTHLYPDPLEAHVWSSSTLYDTKAIKQRRQWFASFIANNPYPGKQELLDYFLHKAPQDPVNGFTINRNEIVKTCSISIVEIISNTASFLYQDLLQNSSTEKTIHFPEKAETSIR